MESGFGLLTAIMFIFNLSLTRDFIAPPTLIAFISLIAFGNLFVPAEAIRFEVYSIFLIIQLVCLIGAVYLFLVTKSFHRNTVYDWRHFVAKNHQMPEPNIIKFWFSRYQEFLLFIWMCGLFGDIRVFWRLQNLRTRILQV